MSAETAIVDLDDLPANVDPMRLALDYLYSANQESEARKSREFWRDAMKKWLLENGEEDENGSYRYYFERPVLLFDSQVLGLMAQRRTSEAVNEAIATNIAAAHGVLDNVLIPITTYELNLDKLYILNQQGIISDDELDSMFDVAETYALVKIL